MEQSTTTARKKSLFLNLVLIVMIIEVSLRVVTRFPVENAKLVSRLWVWHSQGIKVGDITEPAAFVRQKTSQYNREHNSFGFHSPEISIEKSRGKYRLVFLGSSETYYNGPLEDSYPYMVNRFLSEHGIRTEYINAGCPGYTSTECLLSYQLRLRKFQPDMVILYVGRNDLLMSGNAFYQDITDLWHPPFYDSPTRQHRFLSSVSIIYSLLSEFMGFSDGGFLKSTNTNRGRPERLDEFVKNVKKNKVFEVYKRNVEDLCALSKRDKVKIILVGMDFNLKKIRSSAIPEDRQLTDDEKRLFSEMIDSLNSILEQTAGKFSNAYFVNLRNKINRDYFVDDCHLNLSGNKQLAEILGHFIVKNQKDQ